MVHEKVIPAGGVTFVVEYRHFGDDQGPCVRVYGEVGSKAVQLLRFDCFEKSPHYHYDPDGRNEVHYLDPAKGVAAHVQWTLNQLRTQLSEMVWHAGYGEVAQQIDPNAVQEATCQVEKAINELTASGR